VRRLIAESIDSVPELEAVLLLRETPERRWCVDEAGKRLYVSNTVAAHVLNVLAERGFFAREDEHYRYRPETAELAASVDELAATYARELVAVTQLIHAKPTGSVRQFAGVFRLRRD